MGGGMRAGMGLALGALLISCAARTSTPASSAMTSTPDAASGSLTALHMVDAATGWALGDGAVLRTADGGARWTSVTPPADPADPAPGAPGSLVADFADANTAWVADLPDTGGATIAVHATTDGGRKWRGSHFTAADSTARPTAVDFVNSLDGWVLTVPAHTMGTAPGALYATTDGGQTWSEVAQAYAPAGAAGRLPFGGTITFVDPSTGWDAGGTVADRYAGDLYVTHDGGRTWASRLLPGNGGAPGGAHVYAPSFSSPTQGVVPVWSEGDQTTTFYVTGDGGRTWHATASQPGSLFAAVGSRTLCGVGRKQSRTG